MSTIFGEQIQQEEFVNPLATLQDSAQEVAFEAALAVGTTDQYPYRQADQEWFDIMGADPFADPEVQQTSEVISFGEESVQV